MDYFAALNAFVEAAHANNFSRAAEKLSIKASTVSRYIKDLEHDLGIALFNRSTRTLRLTEGARRSCTMRCGYWMNWSRPSTRRRRSTSTRVAC